MTDSQGWQPISNKAGRSSSSFGSRRSSGSRKLPETLRRSPFGKLARTQAFNGAGDGAIALALAGSIFFSIDPSDARWRVALYLVCTIAPFAVVTPLIGPALDRLKGGRRAMIIVSLALRSVIAVLMIGHVDTLWLFPEAFGILILQRAYGIAKSAVVPRLVYNETELVEANSKLALISGLSGASGAAVGGIFALIGGSSWSAGVAAVIFAVGAFSALRLPKVVVADAPIDPEEKAELRSRGITLASVAMAAMRAGVGFVTFLLAFELRGGVDGIDVSEIGAAAGAATGLVNGVDVVMITGIPGAPAWHFGLVVAAAGLGALGGARYAPQLRSRYPEENILLGVILLTFAAALVAAWAGDLFGAVLMAGSIGMGAATGKLVFDAIVQRDAPAANWGRSFARFEARFQLSWAVGAFIPVVLPLTGRPSIGYLIVAAAVGAAGFWYFFGSRGGSVPTLRKAGKGASGPALSDDELRPSLPRPPAGTSEVMARYGEPAAPVRTIPQFEPTQEFEVAAPETPSTATWGDDDYGPVITSTEGVEIDE